MINKVEVGIIAAVMAILASVFFFFPRQTEENLIPEPVPERSAATTLGFSYLPVTPRVSAYYNLGVDSGALITEVTPGSPAAMAGMEVGDVIISFDCDPLEEEPLLGMMMACYADRTIAMEVWRGETIDIIKLNHMGR